MPALQPEKLKPCPACGTKKLRVFAWDAQTKYGECLRPGCIIHPDETIGFEAPGTVTHLFTTESGCMATIALDSGGALCKHIDSYGGGGGNFHHLRVLRDAPTQMEINA